MALKYLIIIVSSTSSYIPDKGDDGFEVQYNYLMKGALKCDPVVFQSLVVTWLI